MSTYSSKLYLYCIVCMSLSLALTHSLSQAQILEFGLTVHEKFVPQDMRPLHKKLVDQFHLMKSSLGIQVKPQNCCQCEWELRKSLCSIVVLVFLLCLFIISSHSLQELPAYMRASPIHFPNGSPRVGRNSMPNILNVEGGRVVARRR